MIEIRTEMGENEKKKRKRILGKARTSWFARWSERFEGVKTLILLS